MAFLPRRVNVKLRNVGSSGCAAQRGWRLHEVHACLALETPSAQHAVCKPSTLFACSDDDKQHASGSLTCKICLLSARRGGRLRDVRAVVSPGRRRQ